MYLHRDYLMYTVLHRFIFGNGAMKPKTYDIHPVNNYYANEKIVDISNSIDAIKIKIKQHELYIMV